MGGIGKILHEFVWVQEYQDGGGKKRRERRAPSQKKCVKTEFTFQKNRGWKYYTQVKTFVF